MSKLPFFAAAPLCQIKVGGTSIAFAVGLSVNVGISLQEIRVLGEYTVKSIEPIAMMPVTGSFQVIRLLKEKTRTDNVTKVSAEKGGALVRTKDEVSTASTQPATIDANTEVTDAGKGGLTGSSDLARHLDPSNILLSQSFDIDISMLVPTVKDGDKWKQGERKLFMTIQNCRISSASANISPGALLTESVEFQGLLAVRYGLEGENAAPIEKASAKIQDLA